MPCAVCLINSILRAVLVPGYGAGAAFYFRNLADLSSRFRTYAVDMLGTGMSGEQQPAPMGRQSRILSRC